MASRIDLVTVGAEVLLNSNPSRWRPRRTKRSSSAPEPSYTEKSATVTEISWFQIENCYDGVLTRRFWSAILL